MVEQINLKQRTEKFSSNGSCKIVFSFRDLSLLILAILFVATCGFGQENPDSLIVNPVQPDSVRSDSLDTLPDSLNPVISDSTLVADSSLVSEHRGHLPEVILVLDTLPLPPVVTAGIRLDRKSWTRQGYKDVGDIISILPGAYPYSPALYAQPAYMIPPGMSARDVAFVYRGRPYLDPITGSADLSAFAPEELETVDLFQGNHPAGWMTSGPAYTLHTPQQYPVIPEARIVHRQGFYGLGHADWRIAQSLTPAFRYHLGVNIGEYEGYRLNSYANTSLLRLGGEQNMGNFGRFGAYWMQTRLDYGRPYTNNANSIHRNDLDLIWRSGLQNDSTYYEIAAWYTRNNRGYYYRGEDGFQLGGRMRGEKSWKQNRSYLQLDLAKSGARFGELPKKVEPKGERDQLGMSVGNNARYEKLSYTTMLRAEISRSNDQRDSRETPLIGRPAFTMNIEYGDSLGFALLGSANMGWRLPGLDESYGYWALHSPPRTLEPLYVPDSSSVYEGNPDLLPVGGIFLGAGSIYRQKQDRSIRIMLGQRQYLSPIRYRQLEDNTWTAYQDKDIQGLEVTADGWLDLWGPFSLAGAYTWSNLKRDDTAIPSNWGWGSARYNDHFFDGHLLVKASFTANYWDSYTYRSLDITESAIFQESKIFLNGLASVTISNFEVYWGTNNLLSAYYEPIPGFPYTHRDEIWGVRWLLFN